MKLIKNIRKIPPKDKNGNGGSGESEGPGGLERLEVGAKRAPRLLVLHDRIVFKPPWPIFSLIILREFLQGVKKLLCSK